MAIISHLGRILFLDGMHDIKANLLKLVGQHWQCVLGLCVYLWAMALVLWLLLLVHRQLMVIRADGQTGKLFVPFLCSVTASVSVPFYSLLSNSSHSIKTGKHLTPYSIYTYFHHEPLLSVPFSTLGVDSLCSHLQVFSFLVSVFF